MVFLGLFLQLYGYEYYSNKADVWANTIIQLLKTFSAVSWSKLCQIFPGSAQQGNATAGHEETHPFLEDGNDKGILKWAGAFVFSQLARKMLWRLWRLISLTATLVAFLNHYSWCGRRLQSTTFEKSFCVAKLWVSAACSAQKMLPSQSLCSV